MNQRYFKTAEGMSNYQAEREVLEALRFINLLPDKKDVWLRENWGKLQDTGNAFLPKTKVIPTSRHYASIEEKNIFDENRELELALKLNLNREVSFEP